ncbi:MAG TPA: GNAT family N-acetyltransferase [Acidimicrobiales bacterium]|nr:GNAT family N-acetyltransferase [Acidimicrobiales bacterium]
MAGSDEGTVRYAAAEDTAAIGRLLHEFNREFGEPAPPPGWLATRVGQLLQHGDTVVLLAGNGPDGLAVLRFRMAIWTEGLEAYLAELYVVPGLRRQGLGRALMTAVMEVCRQRGADTISIEVDEPDVGARRLYESFGFTNREGSEGPLMFVYERDV